MYTVSYMEDRHNGNGHAAYVVAVSMGYGHERAAYALKAIAHKKKIVIANEYKGIPDKDKRLWDFSRRWYERISRFKRIPVAGPIVFGAMDKIQTIPDFYPRRDLSKSTLQLRQMYSQIRRRQWCRHLIDTLAKDPRPLVCTFMTAAFAAEEFAYPEDIYTVICDSDMSRAWVPLEPKKSRIKFFAPTGRVVERLKLYGVPEKNIIFTGFPLPPENIGGVESEIVLGDLARRMCNLDPLGVFATHSRVAIEATLGTTFCSNVDRKKPTPIHVSFAVGGAGAQREIAMEAVKSLSRDISRGRLSFTLVAGTRREINDYFHHELKAARLSGLLAKGKIEILYSPKREEYFKGFAKLMRKTDILWTKPSELSFFSGLGIPIIMSPTVGSQEDFNRNWLYQVGGGTMQLDPKYANEWLWDWINGGGLARMAWNGYVNAPTHGTYRIDDVIHGHPTGVHPLPLVI